MFWIYSHGDNELRGVMAGYAPVYYTTDHPTTGHHVFDRPREVFRILNKTSNNWNISQFQLASKHMQVDVCVLPLFGPLWNGEKLQLLLGFVQLSPVNLQLLASSQTVGETTMRLIRVEYTSSVSYKIFRWRNKTIVANEFSFITWSYISCYCFLAWKSIYLNRMNNPTGSWQLVLLQAVIPLIFHKERVKGGS